MGYFLALIRYGDDFRTLRAYITQFFNSRKYISLNPLVAEQVRILLKNLLEKPTDFEHHLDRYTYTQT